MNARMFVITSVRYECTFINRLLLSESSVQKFLDFLLMQRLQKKLRLASMIVCYPVSENTLLPVATELVGPRPA
jgi:hypothetical protein